MGGDDAVGVRHPATVDDALSWPVAELIDACLHHQLSPVQVAASALERIDRLDPVLHALVSVHETATLAQARDAEAAYRAGDAGPLAGPLSTLWGAFPFTAPFNLGGGPAATVPCGLAGSLPVGVQLATAPHRDGMLLDLAETLEESLDLDVRSLARARVEQIDAPAARSVGLR